jgi:hypothetical protein
VDAFFALLQTLAWIGLIVAVLYVARDKIDQFLSVVIKRVESGSSFKAGPVQLGEDLRALEKKVAASEAMPALAKPTEPGLAKRSETESAAAGTIPWSTFFDEYSRLLCNPDMGNSAKLVAAGVLIEKMANNVAVAFGLVAPGDLRSPPEIVQMLAGRGLIYEAERDAFLEFWALRNKMIHGGAGEPSNEQTARMLDLAWRLVRALA